jgi:hypothetical protein
MMFWKIVFLILGLGWAWLFTDWARALLEWRRNDWEK